MWVQSPKLQLLMREGKVERALLVAKANLQRFPKKPESWTDLAFVHQHMGSFSSAEEVLTRGLRRLDHILLYTVRAYTRQKMGERDGALMDLRAAEQRAPNSLMVLNNLAVVLMENDRDDEAAVYLERILASSPEHRTALSNLAKIKVRKEDFESALELTKRGLELEPEDPELYLRLLSQLRSSGRIAEFQQAFDLERAKRCAQAAEHKEPLFLLAYADDPHWHRQVAREEAAFKLVLPVVTPIPDEGEDRRLRVGYWSWDFCNHATAALISEVFECHDRERFEVFILSYGPSKPDSYGERIRKSAEHFIDFSALSDREAVQRILALDLDILVDLKGYTKSSRMAVSGARPARIVVSWLGYPGTLGSERYDYIIGDPFVTPPGSEVFYDEQVVRLPDSYQPNDRRQQIANPLSREEYGLPADAVVLAAFNATYKITPEVFSTWMGLMKDHPRTILWMAAPKVEIFETLRMEAAACGISSDRIIHAPTVPRAQHLARYQIADLALDCFPYGSHTTGSDALRSGCPMVGLRGASFAASVSASLLNAVLLPELIAESVDEYALKLHRLITMPEERERIRRFLLDHGKQLPLYDTDRFVRHLETAYLEMRRRHLDRLPPAPIEVAEL